LIRLLTHNRTSTTNQLFFIFLLFCFFAVPEDLEPLLTIPSITSWNTGGAKRTQCCGTAADQWTEPL